MSDVSISGAAIAAGVAVAGMVAQAVAVGVWKGRIDSELKTIAANVTRTQLVQDGHASKIDTVLVALGQLGSQINGQLGELRGQMGILVGRRHDDPHV